MNIAASVKTETATTDTARVGDCVARVHAVIRCPHCLRGRLRASGVHQIGEGEFAWRCGHCHRDIITINAD
jgi:predicted SprT family Zn-dependent metalloprotease